MATQGEDGTAGKPRRRRRKPGSEPVAQPAGKSAAKARTAKDVPQDPAVPEGSAEVFPGAATAVGTSSGESVANPMSAGPLSGAGTHGRLRGFLVGLLVVLACLGVVVSGVAGWAHYSLLNTDGYMKIVGPVGKEPKAIRALSDYVATQVVAVTDLQQRTANALPTKGQFLAAPITDAVNSFIGKQTTKVLSSPQAYDIWLGVNRVAHSQIVGLLRGKNTLTYVQGNDVKLNTLPLISRVLVWIDSKLPGGLATKFNPPTITPTTPPDQASQQLSQWLGRPLPADLGQITLLTSKALGPAKTAVRVFDALVIILPIVTALLVAAGIWFSRHRRRTLIELGVGVAVALVVTHVITVRLTDALVNQIKSPNTLSVVRDVVNASLRPLTAITVWIVVLGALVAVAAWLVGRRDVTTAVAKGAKWAIAAPTEKIKSGAVQTGWLAPHADLLRVAGLAVGLLLLLLLSSSWWVVILLLALIILYQLAISWFAGRWPFAPFVAREDA
jgi:hypothetical protein